MKGVGKTCSLFFISFALLWSCTTASKNQGKIEIESAVFHASMKQLTDVIVHDIFSPPVASRVYVYPSIAAYECIAAGNDDYQSLAGQVNGLEPAPKPTSVVNYQAAALMAFLEIGKDLVFSVDDMQAHEDEVLADLKNHLGAKLFKNSQGYAETMVTHIKTWMAEDNYLQTRTYPKFSVNFDEDWRWQPTPPAYMEGIEPHWSAIRTLVIEDADQFPPQGHPAFSLEEDSPFFKELVEVYDIRNKMLPASEEEQVAQFWDCNPYVSVQKGHFMYAVKKITPGGHWVNIVRVASEKDEADFDKSVYAYAKTTIALFDGFISCWDAKYNTSLVRPETLINKHIDENWLPVLQTPPFPEYTSGHSVISTAAAIALTDVFGDNFSFDDTTEIEFGLPIRSFTSFRAASDEAALSRLYGGIHYRAAIEHGVDQGEAVGDYVVSQLTMVSKEKNLAVKE